MNNLVNDLVLEVLRAELRIRRYTLTTPLVASPVLSNPGVNLFLKLENEQYTGSFKARGSMNKVLALSEKERKRGLVTASTGNHGLGLSRALNMANATGVVFLPKNVDSSKLAAIQRYGVDVAFYEPSLTETEAHAYVKNVAAKRGMTWVSPYDDVQVIGGNGTIGIELMQQLKDIDAVFVTVGGGGLISGLSAYLKAVSPTIQIIGCLPENSAEMYHSVRTGEFDTRPSQKTLSDGSAGGFEKNSITFPLCQELVDDWVLVTEEEIKHAVRLVLDEHHKLIEGAAGAAVAGYLKNQNRTYKNVVVIVCGGNMATSTLKEILV